MIKLRYKEAQKWQEKYNALPKHSKTRQHGISSERCKISHLENLIQEAEKINFTSNEVISLKTNWQKLKEFDNALMAYAMTTLIDDIDPMPHFHAAQCYFELGNKDEALKAINLAEALVFQNHSFKNHMNRIQQFKNNLRNI